MDFDLYAPATKTEPPAIPNLRWRKESDGCFTASFEYVYRRMWELDHELLRSAGFGLRTYNEGTYDRYSRICFDPTAASPRRVKEVVDHLLAKHASFIAERARIDAGHAERKRRMDGAVARGQDCIAKYGPTFSSNSKIAQLLKRPWLRDGEKLELDRLATAVEARAKKTGLAR